MEVTTEEGYRGHAGTEVLARVPVVFLERLHVYIGLFESFSLFDGGLVDGL